MEMNFDNNEKYSAFVREKWIESGLNQYKLAEKLGINQSAVSQAVNKKTFSDTTKNGIRARILEYLGFTTETIFRVKKITK